MFLFTFVYSPYYHPLGLPLGNLVRTGSCRSWSLRILRDAISASKETSTTTGCISETWGFWEPHVVFCFILFWCFEIFWPLCKGVKVDFPLQPFTGISFLVGIWSDFFVKMLWYRSERKVGNKCPHHNLRFQNKNGKTHRFPNPPEALEIGFPADSRHAIWKPSTLSNSTGILMT